MRLASSEEFVCFVSAARSIICHAGSFDPYPPYSAFDLGHDILISPSMHCTSSAFVLDWDLKGQAHPAFFLLLLFCFRLFACLDKYHSWSVRTGCISFYARDGAPCHDYTFLGNESPNRYPSGTPMFERWSNAIPHVTGPWKPDASEEGGAVDREIKSCEGPGSCGRSPSGRRKLVRRKFVATTERGDGDDDSVLDNEGTDRPTSSKN